MTRVHSQSLGRANDRTLAALSAAMAMVRLERIGSSIDKTDRLTDGGEGRVFVRKLNCCQYSAANQYLAIALQQCQTQLLKAAFSKSNLSLNSISASDAPRFEPTTLQCRRLSSSVARLKARALPADDTPPRCKAVLNFSTPVPKYRRIALPPETQPGRAGPGGMR
jgi:hypothetical protein